jgi:hypothetical protein
MASYRQLFKRSYVVIALAIAVYVVQQFSSSTFKGTARTEAAIAAGSALPADSVETAFLNQQSDLFLEVDGVVARILTDDTRPPRHQRFILELDSGRTLLVAHNIDLADRIENLKVGTPVRLFGEYEWNDKGGVLHWTHHDPKGLKDGGWIDYDGIRYR